MDFVHCNVCYVCPNSANRSVLSFCFSSCGHLFCSNCAKKGCDVNSSRASNFSKSSFTCPVCNKPSSLLEINRNLRPEVQMYFRSARDLSVQYMQNLKSVMEFQGHHRDRLQKHVNERTSKAVKFAGAAKAQIEKMVERQKKMSAERIQMIRELEKRAERSKIMEKMIAEKDAEICRLRDSSYVLDNSCTLDKTIPGQDLFLNPNDVSGISSKVSSRGSNISSSYAQHASAPSKNSSQLSRKSNQQQHKHYSILSPSGSVVKSNSYNRHYGTPSSKSSSRVQSSPPVFSTSFDGKFKVPKLVPLNSPRAFSNGSGSSSYVSNVSPFEPDGNVMKATVLASYNSKPHLSHTSSSASSNNSAARSVMMAGRIKKGSVISKKLN